MSALDPAQQSTETIYDRLGGDAGLRRLVDVFSCSIFEDPVLEPVITEEQRRRFIALFTAAARDAPVALVRA
jgi:truncated hemoglobin YjbI